VAPSSASNTYLLFGRVKNESISGRREPLPSSFIFAQIGDSFSFSRM
jgi:hypothetical protein